MSFDPYSEWLQIPTGSRPPTYYDILGLVLFERDSQQIYAAFMKRMALVRKYQMGAFGETALSVINKLSEAYGCLSDVAKKATYDQRLRGSSGQVPKSAIMRQTRADAPRGTHAEDDRADRGKPAPGMLPGELPAYEVVIPKEEQEERDAGDTPVLQRGGGPSERRRIQREARRRAEQTKIAIIIGSAAASLILAVGLITWLVTRTSKATQTDVSTASLELASDKNSSNQLKPISSSVSAVPERVGELIKFSGELVRSVAFSPDGQFALSGHGVTTRRTGQKQRVGARPVNILESSAAIRLWDLAARREVERFEGHQELVCGVAFMPNGKSVVSASQDNSIRLWNVNSGKESKCFNGYGATSIGVSKDGNMIVAGGSDSTLKIWKNNILGGWREGACLKGHTAQVTSVAISPDGHYIVSGSVDKTVRAWSTETGKETREFTEPSATVTSVAISADGRRIISGGTDGAIHVLDFERWKEIASMRVASQVHAVALSYDGRLALTGSGIPATPMTGRVDCNVRLWDVENRRELHLFEGHTQEVVSVAFSPNGRRAISGSYDGTIRVWGLPDLSTPATAVTSVSAGAGNPAKTDPSPGPSPAGSAMPGGNSTAGIRKN